MVRRSLLLAELRHCTGNAVHIRRGVPLVAGQREDMVIDVLGLGTAGGIRQRALVPVSGRVDALLLQKALEVVPALGQDGEVAGYSGFVQKREDGDTEWAFGKNAQKPLVVFPPEVSDALHREAAHDLNGIWVALAAVKI